MNLQLLNRYFRKYPEDRSKIFLSVKGCITTSMKADSSPSGVRKSVENSCNVLGSYIDLFQPARVDTSVPIEDTMAELMLLVKEGKIRSIGLSECGPETIRRAAKVGKVAAVEQEYSLWANEIEQIGIIDACKDNKIALVAYSPLGRGMLTGQIRSRGDIPKDDMRLHYPRFSEENFSKNLQLVDKLEELANKKGCTASQLGIGWCIAQSVRLGLQVLPIPGCTSIERLKENVGGRDVNLSTEELSEIDGVLSSIEIVGGRYPDFLSAQLYAESRAK